MTPNRLFAALAPLLLAACARPVVYAPAPAPAPSDVRRGNSESVHVLGIPPGQLPRAGQCRVWVPGVPPGRQAKRRSCDGILATAPAGSWIVYRSAAHPDVVHVHVVDRARAGVIVMIRHYEVSGTWLRDEEPGNHHEDEHEDDRGRGRGRRRNS